MTQKQLIDEQTKEFGVYHWDTFDNETIRIDEFDTLDEATDFVEKDKYKGRISPQGADKVDIVDKSGTIRKQYSVK